MAQICKKCLLREMAEADAKMIEKYKEAIKKEDQVSESEYERRLTVCKTCELLNAGTCGACGCYVELRAAAAVSKCLASSSTARRKRMLLWQLRWKSSILTSDILRPSI